MKKRNNKKKSSQSNFSKLSVFQNNKYKFTNNDIDYLLKTFMSNGKIQNKNTSKILLNCFKIFIWYYFFNSFVILFNSSDTRVDYYF